MRPAATMWIRDGVLVNRMHVNPVAFAYSYWVFTAPEQRAQLSIEELINFGFAKSGVSCAEKMSLFNNEANGGLGDIKAAAAFYDELATCAAESCTYFNGMPELLADLHRSGVRNFITSAVRQQVLDQWKESSQGSLISASLTETLGARDGFTKGRDHFAHISSIVSGGQIYYVADAVSEISTAKKFSEEFNIVPIGFGYVIDHKAILDAVYLIKKALSNSLASKIPYSDFDHEIDPDRLAVATERQVEDSLLEAGASFVAKGSAESIADNLKARLIT